MNPAQTIRKIAVPLALILAGGCTSSKGSPDSVNWPVEPLPAEKSAWEETALKETILFYEPLPTVEEVVAGSIEQAAETLRQTYQKEVTPENIVYLTRLLFYEAGGEPEEGIKGVMEVILNRWKFDQGIYFPGSRLIENATGKKRFGDGSLMSIVSGERAKEWNAIRAHPEEFSQESFRDEQGAYTIYPETVTGKKTREKFDLCLRIVYSGLMGAELASVTGGALFYKNPDKSKKDVPGEGALFGVQVGKGAEYWYQMTEIAKIGDHIFYGGKIGVVVN